MRYSQLSKSLQETIYVTIRNDIIHGKYQIGDMLPSENAIAKIFGTARMTVRNAMIRLIDEGYLYSIASKGYFVKEKKYNKYSFEFDETKIFDIEVSHVKLISLDIIKPDVDLAYHLRMPSDSKIVAIKRLLFAEDVVAAYDEKFIPYYTGIPINESQINQATIPEIISNKESQFTLKKNLNMKVVISNPNVSEIFGFKSPDDVFLVEQIFLDEEDNPVGWSRMTYRMEFIKIKGKVVLNK